MPMGTTKLLITDLFIQVVIPRHPREVFDSVRAWLTLIDPIFSCLAEPDRLIPRTLFGIIGVRIIET